MRRRARRGVVTLRTRPLAGVRRLDLKVDGRIVLRKRVGKKRFVGARGWVAARRLAGAGRVSVIIRRHGTRPIVVHRRLRVGSAPAPRRLGAPPVSRGPVTGDPAPGRAPAPSPTSAPAPAPAPATPARGPSSILWGAWVDGDAYGPGYDDPPWDMSALSVFESHAGKSASVVHYGQFWRVNGTMQPFYAGDHQRVRDHGAYPLLDWNPWDANGGGSTHQPDFSLRRIADGHFDAYITSWASAARDWGHPFFLRFAHEMNGTWYPWSEAQNGNAPGDYVRAWRHVHDIFRSVGASNVTWVWSPNAIYPGSLPLAGLYPGDAYVDWVAIDGYNWGLLPARPDVWRSFTEVIGPTYEALGHLAPAKPVMIAETGSTEHGGSKAAWIADALARIPVEMPRIGAVVWFNWDAEADWSIETSPSATAAFADGIARPEYAGSDFASASGSPIDR